MHKSSTAQPEYADCPYVVQNGFQGHSPTGRVIEFQTGNRGRVLNDTGRHRSGCYLVSTPPSQSHLSKEAYVKKSSVSVGSTKIGQWRVKFDIDTKGIKPPLLPPGTTSSQLMKALMHFFGGMRGNGEVLGLMSSKVYNMSQATQQAVCNAILSGVRKAGLGDVFEKKSFTLADITNNAREFHANSAGSKIAGIYLWAHRGADRRVHLYVGSSLDIMSRAKAHRTNSKNASNKSMHYTTWRNTVDHKLFVLCEMPSRSEAERELIYLAELFFITMGLETYPATLLNQTADDVAAANQYADVSDEMDTDTLDGQTGRQLPLQTILQAPETSSSPAKTSAARFVCHRAVAAAMSRVVEEVKKTSSWPGGIRRKEFGSSNGLNASTPLSVLELISEPIVYTKIQGANMTCWSRTSQRVIRMRNNNSLSVVLFRSTGASSQKEIRPSWQDRVAPAYGTEVFITFERVHTGAHPFQYARLCDLRETADWDLAQSLAVAMTWQEGGRWRKRYIQSYHVNQISKGAPSKSYIEAIGMIRSLQQERFDGPVSARLFEPALVMRTSFSWLQQTLLVETLPEIYHVGMMRPYSVAHRCAALVRMGAQNMGRRSDQVNLAVLSQGQAQARKRCDYCYVVKTASDHIRGPMKSGAPHSKCETGPETGSACKNCYLFGIQCSWTRFSQITRAYKAAVLPKPLQDDLIFDVADPTPIDIKDPDLQA